MTLTLELGPPDDLAQLRLPQAVEQRLNDLSDRQDTGRPLSEQERREAEGLVNLAEYLTRLGRELLVSLTPSARATVVALKLNRPLIQAIRAEEMLRGRHPPAP